MSKLQPVRGTRDIFGEDMRRQRHVADTARAVAELYGYQEIATPVFEFSEVFKRTLGDTSDIVTKEMYSFTDNGGETITLRPENTAGVARAVISGGLAQNIPLKFFYAGPMFRYERPQKGRYRQFHQIGIELIGVPEPLADIEVDRRRRAHPGQAGRAAARDAGAEFAGRCGKPRRLSQRARRLSPRARRQPVRGQPCRLDRNPLRILDSKDESDIAHRRATRRS